MNLFKCVGCHEEKETFTLRKGVTKCSQCISDQIGRSLMDLFRKGIKNIPPPVNVLISISGGSNSYFTYHLLKNRLNLNFSGKSAVVKKLEPISTFDLPIENLHKISNFNIKNLVEYAKINDFNCIILGDNVERISLSAMAVLSQGRPDLFHFISTNDHETYLPIHILRPNRQSLNLETEFYCKLNNLNINIEKSLFQKTFDIEWKMLLRIGEEGSESTPFAVQKMAERLPYYKYNNFCNQCGLPLKNNKTNICEICNSLNNFK